MVDEDTLRDRLATCTRILTMKGLIGLYGHVSAFDPDTGRVYVSPGAGSPGLLPGHPALGRQRQCRPAEGICGSTTQAARDL